MFGDRIRGRADLGQNAGGGGSLQEIPFPAFEHRRQDRPRGVNVGHQIHVPEALPVVVRSVLSSLDGDTGVRAEEIDPPVLGQRGGHELADLVFVGDVAADCGGGLTDRFSCLVGLVEIEIGDN